MNRFRLQILVGIVGSLLIAPSLSAQVGTITDGQMVLEASTDVAAGLKKCDILHHVSTCDNYHWTPAETAVSTLTVGEIVRFDDQAFVLEWYGPGYHLENGMIVEPSGAAANGLTGQVWIEVYPQEGSVHTSTSWSDVDQNGVVGRSDRLQLDFGAFAVEDVRLHLRVRPAGR